MHFCARFGRSMAYSVIVTSNAQAEFKSAIEYLSQNIGVISAASELVDEFDGALDLISALPRSFPRHHEASGLLDVDIRVAHVKKYNAYFFVDEDSRTVFVISFLHMLQDSMSHISADFDSYIKESASSS